MSAPRLLAVVGTRPEAIKVAPVVLAARAAGTVEPTVLATGQHDHLVDRALRPFGIVPDLRFDLGDDRGSSQAELVGRLLPHLDAAMEQLAPDAVLVQGDTASALVGAMVGFWHRVPVVHLEAGLRSFDVENPFPEETYRRVIADLASLHLPPTPAAARNLLAERIDAAEVLCIGNTVVDAALHVARRPGAVGPLTDGGRRLVLVTVHRRENWGAPLASVLDALTRLVATIEDIEVVLPVHPNPTVREAVVAAAAGTPRMRVVEPLDHPALIAHLEQATLVLTDSGGVQEEAPTFGTPVLVLRTTTERPEAVEAGCAELVGTDADHLLARATRLLTDESARQVMARSISPFGDGASGGRAVDAVRWMLGAGPRPEPWVPASSSAELAGAPG